MINKDLEVSGLNFCAVFLDEDFADFYVDKSMQLFYKSGVEVRAKAHRRLEGQRILVDYVGKHCVETPTCEWKYDKDGLLSIEFFDQCSCNAVCIGTMSALLGAETLFCEMFFLWEEEKIEPCVKQRKMLADNIKKNNIFDTFDFFVSFLNARKKELKIGTKTKTKRSQSSYGEEPQLRRFGL
eukprot:TRINITY_DN2064_c0_g1_i1.p1 TRINITY_DN2064_c0_g1~~TRINITY_DN2064_c0_g1_i1.p1  ORF type:complete len:209 (-),score=69.57 TRINITY_DN2064_c0_g1_i1:250-798(-)